MAPVFVVIGYMQESNNIDLTSSPDPGLSGLVIGRKTVLLALGAVAVIYLAGLTGRWWPAPDSALYLSLGRSMAQGEGYRINGVIAPVVPPGFPWILAALYSLFGGGFWAPNLFEALCGIATVCLIYLTLARLGGKAPALLAAVMTGLSYSFYLNSHEVLSDMPAAAAFWAMTYATLRAQKGAWLWLIPAALLAAGVTFLRIPGMLAVFAMAVAMALDRATEPRKLPRMIRAGVPLAAGGAALVGLYFWGKSLTTTTLAYTPTLNENHFNLPLMGSNLLKTLSDTLTGQRSWEIGLLGLALMLAGIISRWRRGSRLPAVVILYCLIVYCLTGGWAIQPRYWLPVQAFALYAMLQGLLWAVGQICRWRQKPASPKTLHVAALALAGLVVAFNIPQVINWAGYYSYLSLAGQSGYYDKIRKGNFQDLYPVVDILKRNVGPGQTVGVNGNTANELGYLSERRVLQLEGSIGVKTVLRGKPVLLPDAARLEHLLDSTHVLDGDPRLRLVVLENDDKAPEFTEGLKKQLQQMRQEGKVKLLYEGKVYTVFQRT